MDQRAVVELLQGAVPDLIAVYLFGSEAAGEASPTSDVDLALLSARPLEPSRRWHLQEELAGLLRRDVDLVDLGATATVLRAQVISGGTVLADLNTNARAWFEATALSDYARLNEERRGILDDIRERGTIYG